MEIENSIPSLINVVIKSESHLDDELAAQQQSMTENDVSGMTSCMAVDESLQSPKIGSDAVDTTSCVTLSTSQEELPRTDTVETIITCTSSDYSNPGSQGSPVEKPKRTKRRVHGQKICGVCGDRAIAHNFGALTCETCKAFFRRNANRTRDIPSCSFDRKCVINKTTRRFCTSCRMEKCFAIGMDPLLILDENEKQAMRARRKKKQNLSRGDSAVDSSTPCPPDFAAAPMNHPGLTRVSSSDVFRQSGLSSVSAANDGFYSEIGGVNLASPYEMPTNGGVSGSSTDASGLSVSPPSAGPGADHSTADTAIPTHSADSSSSSAFCVQRLAQGCRFRQVERDELPWDIQLYWPLTKEERSLLTQLTSSYTNIQISLNPPEPTDDFNPEEPHMDDLIYILDATLRKCVRFAKVVPDFKELREADQIACLKASAVETYSLRSAALFIQERNAWHTYLGDMTVVDVKKRFQEYPVIDIFAGFCRGLKSVAKTNPTLYALLHCITLFDVRDTKLEERVKISLLKDKYIILLKHYLESEFSFQHAGRYTLELMAHLEDMHNLRNVIIVFYKQFATFFRPLVAEFLAS